MGNLTKDLITEDLGATGGNLSKDLMTEDLGARGG